MLNFLKIFKRKEFGYSLVVNNTKEVKYILSQLNIDLKNTHYCTAESDLLGAGQPTKKLYVIHVDLLPTIQNADWSWRFPRLLKFIYWQK